MSKLLEESLIDAKALKEAALKSAQQAVLEQHAPEVKKALKMILEQETLPPTDDMQGGLPDLGGGSEPDLGMGDMGGMPAPEMEDGPEPSDAAKGLPLAATEGEKLCACPDEEEEIEIDFGELEKQMQASVGGEPELGNEQAPEPPINLSLNEEIDEDLKENHEEIEIDEDLIKSLFEVEAVESDLYESDSEVEDETINENILHAGEICEDAHPEMSHEDWEEQHNKDSKKTKKEDDELKAASLLESKLKKLNKSSEDKSKVLMNESKEMKAQVSSLISENKELKIVGLEVIEENKKIRNTITKLTKHLEDLSLSNARLLFTNQALSSDSLNERQKQKIVEAITNAGSVDEVKLVYETLQNTVGSVGNKNNIPKSLKEIVQNNSGLVFSSRSRENDNTESPAFKRWQKVAGIVSKKQS